MQGGKSKGTGILDVRSRMLELQVCFELSRQCAYINTPRASLQMIDKMNARNKQLKDIAVRSPW